MRGRDPMSWMVGLAAVVGLVVAVVGVLVAVAGPVAGSAAPAVAVVGEYGGLRVVAFYDYRVVCYVVTDGEGVLGFECLR